MTPPPMVSEDLYRQQLGITQQLAGSISEHSRTLAQVVEIQKSQHDEIQRVSSELRRMDAARAESVSEIKDHVDETAGELRAHVSDKVTSAIGHMETTVSREVDRLEFWRKPTVVLAGLVALTSLIVDVFIRIIAVLKG